MAQPRRHQSVQLQLVSFFGYFMSKIEMKNVSFAYDGQANLFENVSQVLDTSCHLGLVGRNGRGKRSFKLIQN